jgi:hypothetical protein
MTHRFDSSGHCRRCDEHIEDPHTGYYCRYQAPAETGAGVVWAVVFMSPLIILAGITVLKHLAGK